MSTIACSMCGESTERESAPYSASGTLVCNACHARSLLDDKQITSARYGLYVATFLLVFSIVLQFDPFRILTVTSLVLGLRAHKLSKMMTSTANEVEVATKRIRIWALVVVAISGAALLLTALVLGRVLVQLL